MATLGSFPPPFSNVEGLLTQFPEFAVGIGDGNILECLTIGTYICNLKDFADFQDVLGEHLDWENYPHPSTWDITVVAWKIFCTTSLATMMQFKDHWCKKLLENTKAIALLLLITPTSEKSTVHALKGMKDLAETISG